MTSVSGSSETWSSRDRRPPSPASFLIQGGLRSWDPSHACSKGCAAPCQWWWPCGCRGAHEPMQETRSPPSLHSMRFQCHCQEEKIGSCGEGVKKILGISIVCSPSRSTLPDKNRIPSYAVSFFRENLNLA